MREPTFFVLAALAHQKMHGYAIIQEAAALSDGRIELKTGTLYAALDRLTRQGLIAAAGEEVVDGRNRRYYELTVDGAACLEHEVSRMEAKARSARARLVARATATATAPSVGAVA